MTDPLLEDLQSALHGAMLGDQLLCDYHGTSASLATDAPVVIEAIRILDPRYKTHEEVRWQADAVRCADCPVGEIAPPTFGFEEAVLRIPVARSNDVVSIACPDVDNIAVLAYSSPADGSQPMATDQQYQEAADGDAGAVRWARVRGLLESDPPQELREHVERLIEESPETPSSFE